MENSRKYIISLTVGSVFGLLLLLIETFTAINSTIIFVIVVLTVMSIGFYSLNTLKTSLDELTSGRTREIINKVLYLSVFIIVLVLTRIVIEIENLQGLSYPAYMDEILFIVQISVIITFFFVFYDIAKDVESMPKVYNKGKTKSLEERR